jgi:hypothetical protein
MKNKFIYGLALVSLVASSCTKDFEEMNTDSKRPIEVPAQPLFANAALEINRQVVTLNVNRNNLKLWSQYITQTTYIDESNYNLVNRNIPQTEWLQMYREILKDLSESKKFTEAETILNDADFAANTAAKQNRLAIIDIYTVYCYERLSSIFGDIPYSEALTETNLPAYDDAETISRDLVTRLDAALANLDNANGSFDAGYENLFDGDVAMWEKFANGLKLKIAMTFADADAGYAETIFKQAEGNVFSSQGEIASFTFLSGAPNTNPMWVDLVQSGRADYVGCATTIDTMVALNDPRISVYYTPTSDGSYIGGEYGAAGNKYATMSHIGDYFHEQTQPTILMDYVEMEFYKAEAAARGWGVIGSAKEHYDNAVTASILYWDATADASAYLSGPDVDFASGNAISRIAVQAWLAYFNRGMLGWTTNRRLDIPALPAAANTGESTPARYTYPVNEQTLNGTSHGNAASAIGGDLKSTKLWWDKN